MDILEALAKQNKPAEQERKIMDDGMLPMSDAVFECELRRLGVDKEEIKEWLEESPELRVGFIAQMQRDNDWHS